MPKKLLVLLIFIGISIYLWYPAFNSTEQVATDTDPVLVPDFTAKLLHQELFDHKGDLKQEVFSQKMEHFADLDLTYFEQPEFIIYQDDNPYWRLSAKVGNMQDGRLILDENVQMLQLNNNELVNSIETSYLEINLNSQIVTTDKLFVIKGQRTTITGHGLNADLKEGRVKMTKHVQTILKGNQQ